MAKPNIEALAQEIAHQFVYDWVTGDSWYGYPNGEDEEAAAVRNYMPTARKEAERLLRIAGVID